MTKSKEFTQDQPAPSAEDLIDEALDQAQGGNGAAKPCKFGDPIGAYNVTAHPEGFTDG